MAKAKSPRSTTSNKQVLTMPEAGSVSPAKRISSTEIPTAGAARTGSSNNHSGSTDLDEKIRQRAYELYQQRGQGDGFEHEDWLKAEREILARHNRLQSA
jgi:hypothetical protein